MVALQPCSTCNRDSTLHEQTHAMARFSGLIWLGRPVEWRSTFIYARRGKTAAAMVKGLPLSLMSLE